MQKVNSFDVNNSNLTAPYLSSRSDASVYEENNLLEIKLGSITAEII